MKNNLSLVLVVIYALLLPCLAPPLFNWDIIGYTAATYYQEGHRGDSLRQMVFTELQSLVPANDFANLTLASPYREAVFTDPQSLEEHMPFYTIRMGYIAAIKATSSIFSIPYATSTYILSGVFSSICILLLGILFPTKSAGLILVFPVILYIAGFWELARLSSPDAMAAALALLVLLFRNKARYLLLIPLVLIPWIRTDYVILAGLLGLVAAYNKRFTLAGLYILLPLLSYLLVNKLNNNYGYLKIFNFTLIGINAHPATMPIETSLAPYLQAYWRGFGELLGHRHFIVFFAYAFIWFRHIRPRKMAAMNEQIFIVLGFVVLHILLFPAYYERFFTWCAAIAGLQMTYWLYEIYFLKRFNNLIKSH